MGEQFIQSARLSFDEIAQIQSFDRANATANVAVSFSLREHTIGGIVGITARGQSGETYAAHTAFLDGRFVADITLPLRNNFTLSFTAESGDTLTTGELMQFNLAEMLNRRFEYWLSQGSSVSGAEHTIWFTPSFRNETRGNSALEVQSLSLVLELENEVIRNWDLTPYLRVVENLQLLQMENYDTFRLDVSEGGDVAPNENAIARLIIYDNLGIRYEQVDMIFTGTGITHVVGRSFSQREVFPVPVPAQVWADGFHGDEWGFIRIVD
jgi:hypothetical protein